MKHLRQDGQEIEGRKRLGKRARRILRIKGRTHREEIERKARSARSEARRSTFGSMKRRQG